MPKYKGAHLTWTDRLTIEKMLRQGCSKPQIARYLGVHHSTIYDECKRGAVELVDSELRTYTTYSPEVAEAYHKKAVKNMEKGLKIGKDRALANWLVETISAGYSPAAACALLGKTPETTFSCTLCRQTVYKYIDRGDLWPLTNKKLRYKGTRKRKYNQVRAAKAPRGESIERRPENVDSRMEPGHWEMDSVVSGRGGKAALLVLTERATRYEIAVRVPDHTSASVVSALDRLERRFGSREFRRLFKTITVDNGSEFSDRWGMERSWRTHWKQRTRIFYCHPYSSWERGSNEKQNQMIRWHFPKGTNFTKISQSRIDDAIEWLNNYPRKILGWRSAGEVFREFLASVI